MVLLMEIARHSNHFKLSSNSSSIEIYRLHPSKFIVVSPRTVKGYLHKGFDQVRTVLTESSWELFCGAHCRSHFVMGPVGIEQSIWDHPEYQVWPRSHAPDPFVHGPWPISPVHSNAYIYSRSNGTVHSNWCQTIRHMTIKGVPVHCKVWIGS